MGNQFGETNTDNVRPAQSVLLLENWFGETSTDDQVRQSGGKDLDAIPSDNEPPRPGWYSIQMVHLVLHPHGIAPSFLKLDSWSLGEG